MFYVKYWKICLKMLTFFEIMKYLSFILCRSFFSGMSYSLFCAYYQYHCSDLCRQIER